MQPGMSRTSRFNFKWQPHVGKSRSEMLSSQVQCPNISHLGNQMSILGVQISNSFNPGCDVLESNKARAILFKVHSHFNPNNSAISSNPINCARRVVKAHAQMNDTCLVQSRGKATANKLKAGA